MAKSQENGITILLGLKGYRVDKVTEEEGGIIAVVRARQGKSNCPRCGSAKLYRHGLGRRRRVLHSWNNGKKVYLELCRQRWRCQECGCSFNEGAGLLRPYSRITKQAELEALWQLRDRSFSHVERELGVSYSTLRRLLEREIDEESLGFIREEEEIFLGIDEHSFRHQDMVHTVTEVKNRKMLAILRDDRVATLKGFLNKIPRDKVKEVCIDMKESLRKVVEETFPEAKVVVDPFHVIADSNRRMDEARKIEQDVLRKRKIKIPKKVFLIGGEKLSDEGKDKVNGLLARHPSLKGFYWAKEKIRELYRQKSREEATRLLDLIIFNLRSEDDGELVRWGNTLRRWREPILNHFYNGTTNGFTEGCNTKIKMLKRVSYGLRNVDVYWRKILLGFAPSRSCFHTI
jgi:transposase